MKNGFHNMIPNYVHKNIVIIFYIPVCYICLYVHVFIITL